MPVAALERKLGLDPGSLTGSDLVRAGEELADASVLVRDLAGRDWVADDGVTITAPAAVLKVVRDVALRGYRNPDGFRGENVGDYGYQRDAEEASAALTPAEEAIVRRAAGTGRVSVYTVGIRSAYADPAPADPFPAVVA
ncbi:hypothetical protein [Micromonospora sediminicola]|uniref:hypothetical protein n=1 Tax=Micromonospora sediminicola TaxID=946078 RepID=UPI0037AFEF08